MENEFVSYEKAVALKELGFYEPCLGSYETAFSRGVDFQLGYIISGPKNYVLTPLKQQVFRWFREKHNLIGLIEGGYDSYKNVYSYVIWKGSDDDWLYYYWETYEEAENACIDKLIELAKQQDNGN